MSQLETVHGIHAVQALLERHAERVQRVYVARGRDDARVVALLRAAEASGVAIERVDAARLERMAGAAVHQGVVAEVRPLAPWNEDRLTATLSDWDAARGAPLVLALDGVQDLSLIHICRRPRTKRCSTIGSALY